MISDPVAQCQAALGLEPVGLVPKDKIYSNYWRTRNVTLIDAARSPMIDQSEHNPLEVMTDDEEADYWFRYLQSGIIFSTYDTSCYRHADSD